MLLLPVRKKRSAFKKWNFCKTEHNWQLYAEKRNKATRSCRFAKRNFERELAGNLKTDPKSFHSYVRSQLKSKTHIADLESQDGSLLSSDVQKAELLNSFFSSVFTNEDVSHIPTMEDRNFETFLEDIYISPSDVEKKLDKLKSNKSPGIDSIHPLLLKECAHELSEVLADMFNQSIQSGSLPSLWKKAQVTPIFKKGNKHLCSNYRPVSLTVILCKVLETFIRDEIVKHLDSNNLFVNCQHGFRSKRSCTTQLLEVIDHWSEILEEGGQLDCIYLDFAKAFDTVPHQRLMKKLYAYGIRGKVHSWVESFLSNRQQQVRIGSSCSSWSPVKSGIPQGSVLGPTLFLVYINDLPEVVSNIVKLFADDTKIYREIKGPDDVNSIQSDLDRLAEWSDEWLLRFNASKCKCLHIGKDNPGAVYSMSDTSGRTNVLNVDNEKDLGVIFDSKLSFSEHIAAKVKRANQALGTIKRTFTYMDKDIFIPLYKAYIRPHLEYASVIWTPSYQKDILAIEQVQRRATRLVPGMKQLSYEERLRALGLPTLMYRRERTDIFQVFKILNNYEEVNMRKNMEMSKNTTTRGHSFKLEKRRALSKFGQKRFCTRSTNPWNALSESTVCAPSVNAFKSRLNTDWKYRESKFSIPSSRQLLPSRVDYMLQPRNIDNRSRLGQYESEDSHQANRKGN